MIFLIVKTGGKVKALVMSIAKCSTWRHESVL